MGVPMHYGTCQGGPWHGKQMAHPEPVYPVPLDRLSRRPMPGVRLTEAGAKNHVFAEYRWDGKGWVWHPAPDSK